MNLNDLTTLLLTFTYFIFILSLVIFGFDALTGLYLVLMIGVVRLKQEL